MMPSRNPTGDNVPRGRPRHFLDRRDPLQHLAPAVLAQGEHPALDGLVADEAGVDTLDDEIANDVTRDHQFVDAGAAAVAALATGPAAGPLPQRGRWSLVSILEREV